MTGLTLYRHQIITITGWVMRVSVLAGVLCLVLVSVGNADPASAAIRKSTNIPAEPLDLALKSLARERQFQVLFRAEVVRDVRTGGAVGDFTPEEAIKQLLSGTGLSYQYLDANTVTVFAAAAPAGVATASSQDHTNTAQDKSQEAGKKSSQEFRVAQASPGQAEGNVSVDKQDERVARKPVQLEEVIVTGSRLARTASEGPQAVKVLDREKIESSGATTLAELLQTVPEISVANIESSPSAGSAGTTTVQLRGLPQGATLVLLNGRRVEATGLSSGTFFDLNNIPLSAIDRIEILPSGSSAIYGGDALAGVVNIILKKNIGGAEADIQYGGASGTRETRASVDWGWQSSKAAVSVIASYLTRSELLGAERSITANQDYTRFGGPDLRLPYSTLANIYSIDGSNLPGLPGPEASVPAGSSGVGLSPANFLRTVGVVNETSFFSYSALLPASKRYGVFVSGTYDLVPSIQVFTEVLYSFIQQDTDLNPNALYAVVPASNAFNPFGTDVAVQYVFSDPAGFFHTRYRQDFFRPVVGIRGSFADSWHWEVSALDSTDYDHLDNFGEQNSNAINAALSSSNPATALNVFQDGPGGSRALLNSLFQDIVTTYRGSLQSLNAFISGPIAHLNSGDITALVGGEYERSKLTIDDSFNPTYTVSRHNHAGFGEIKVPILANHREPSAGDVLALQGAVRYDSYSDFGNKVTEQSGLEFRPASFALLRGTYSTAFQPPTLSQLYAPRISFPTTVTDPRNGGVVDSVTEICCGGNPALNAETGNSTTAGFVLSPPSIKGLDIAATYWSMHLKNGAGSPSPQFVVDNENLFPDRVVRGPSVNGQPGPIQSVDVTYLNFGTTDVSGVDVGLIWRAQSRWGEVTPSVSATNTFRYITANSPDSPRESRVSVADTSNNFAPRWKGTFAVSWKPQPNFQLSLDSRYVSRYRDYQALPSGSFGELGNIWYFDANAKYTTGKEHGNSAYWPNLSLSLGVVNLFNRLPDFSNYIGYDPAEYDIRGRFVYASLGAKW